MKFTISRFVISRFKCIIFAELNKIVFFNISREIAAIYFILECKIKPIKVRNKSWEKRKFHFILVLNWYT